MIFWKLLVPSCCQMTFDIFTYKLLTYQWLSPYFKRFSFLIKKSPLPGGHWWRLDQSGIAGRWSVDPPVGFLLTKPTTLFTIGLKFINFLTDMHGRDLKPALKLLLAVTPKYKNKIYFYLLKVEKFHIWAIVPHNTKQCVKCYTVYPNKIIFLFYTKIQEKGYLAALINTI